MPSLSYSMSDSSDNEESFDLIDESYSLSAKKVVSDGSHMERVLLSSDGERLRRVEEELSSLKSRMDSVEQLSISSVEEERDREDKMAKMKEENAHLIAELSSLQAQLQQKTMECEWKSADCVGMTKELAKKDQEIEERQQDIDRKDAQIENLYKELEERDSEFEDFYRQIEESDRQIEEKETELRQKNAKIVEFITEIKEQKSSNAAKYVEITKKDRQLEERDKVIGRKEKEIARLESIVKRSGLTFDKKVENIRDKLLTAPFATQPTVFPHSRDPLIDNAAEASKEWHAGVTDDLRYEMIGKLINGIFPNPDPATLEDPRIKDLEQYARKVEHKFFTEAANLDEYSHLLAEKIYAIQKELASKKKKRLGESNLTTVPQPVPNQSPAVATIAPQAEPVVVPLSAPAIPPTAALQKQEVFDPSVHAVDHPIVAPPMQRFMDDETDAAMVDESEESEEAEENNEDEEEFCLLEKARNENEENEEMDEMSEEEAADLSKSKGWRAEIAKDLRDRLVGKLVTAMVFVYDAESDQKKEELFECAKSLENSYFLCADDREEYFHLIAAKINKIHKDMEDK